MSLLLLVLAALCELIAALTGFDVLIHAKDNLEGWIALGLFFWICSLLVGPVVAFRRE